MISQFKIVGKHSLIYGIGSALSMGAGFLLIPLYTNVLLPAEYGILEILNRSAEIIMLVMFMGVRQAYIRFYFDEEGAEWKRTVTATTIFFVSGASVFIILTILPFKDFISNILFNSHNTNTLILLLLLWLPFEAIFNIGITNLQVQMKSGWYVSINSSKFALIIISNIILVYFYNKGIFGILITNLWVAALLALCFIVYFVKSLIKRISFKLMRELIKFGLPFLPSTFFMFIICNSDRFILKAYSELEAVGIYSLAYKIGMLGTMILMEPFQKVWTPFLFDNYNKVDGDIIVGKFFTFFTMIMVVFCLAVSIGSPVIIPLISSKAYHSSYKLIPLICLASIFYGMACIADAGILIAKKTKLKPLIFGVAGMISLCLNFLLIPKFGSIGAAVALSTAFLFLLIFTYRTSSRFFPFLIEYKKIIIIFLAAAIIFFLSSYLSNHGFKWLALFLLFIYPFLLWISGYFSIGEKKQIKGYIKNYLNKFSIEKPSSL